MRRAGAVLRDLFDELSLRIKPGVSTGELDAYIEKYIRDRGCRPSFKNLYGFPASACISVNDEVVHGIPGKRALASGDVVKVDVGAVLGGLHADAARTFPVGEIGTEARRLLETTRAALEAGLAQARVGNRVSDISSAVQKVAETAGYSVVRDYVGHGVGRKLHEEPQVPNYVQPGRRDVRLKAGMTLAIEPMVNEGSFEVVVARDKWTVRTADGRLSANFEDTVAVTEDGPYILTR
jgi:methionyl aminopeptidase